MRFPLVEQRRRYEGDSSQMRIGLKERVYIGSRAGGTSTRRTKMSSSPRLQEMKTHSNVGHEDQVGDPERKRKGQRGVHKSRQDNLSAKEEFEREMEEVRALQRIIDQRRREQFLQLLDQANRGAVLIQKRWRGHDVRSGNRRRRQKKLEEQEKKRQVLEKRRREREQAEAERRRREEERQKQKEEEEARQERIRKQEEQRRREEQERRGREAAKARAEAERKQREIQLAKQRENDSAVRIQSSFRGYHGRKQVLPELEKRRQERKEAEDRNKEPGNPFEDEDGFDEAENIPVLEDSEPRRTGLVDAKDNQLFTERPVAVDKTDQDYDVFDDLNALLEEQEKQKMESKLEDEGEDPEEDDYELEDGFEEEPQQPTEPEVVVRRPTSPESETFEDDFEEISI